MVQLVTGISLDKTTLALDTGSNATLKAAVDPTDATNKVVVWSSDNTAVATVDNAGKVTAVKAGTANITAKTDDQGKTAVTKVTVTDPAPAE
ncbi:Ig domain-containing protein [Weissella paramesenteroides]|nr:Ig domain-containing protein [Weissella paramesenteroides]KAA8452764.1 Ig domain-containing protein [Weissella paramesenteroides]